MAASIDSTSPAEYDRNIPPATAGATPPAVGKPPINLPRDEEIGDEGIPQYDAGDNSFFGEEPGKTGRSGPENGQSPTKPS